ncbi:MAG: DUF4251 domain-containing protein [Eudoraea sp.]
MFTNSKNYFSLILLSLLLWSCGSTSNTTERDYTSEKLDALVAKQSFEIIADWAYPQMTSAMNQVAMAGLFAPGSAPGQINLIGNINYFRIMGDSIDVYLPYYGERQMSSGYGQSDSSIKFKGVPKDFNLKWNEKNNRYDLNLSFNRDAENFKINAQLFPNLKASMTITSSSRFPIRYVGEIKQMKLASEKEDL